MEATFPLTPEESCLERPLLMGAGPGLAGVMVMMDDLSYQDGALRGWRWGREAMEASRGKRL